MPGPSRGSGPFIGLRVVEMGDESVDYAGLLLAGLGAEVIKVEPPEGSPGRRIGPFYEDVVDPERSLFFWCNNRGKRSVVLDLERAGEVTTLSELLGAADVLLDSTERGRLPALGLAPDAWLDVGTRPAESLRRRRTVGGLQDVGSGVARRAASR